MIWWNDPCFLTTLLSPWRKIGLICTGLSSDPVGKSSSKVNYIERRGCPGGVTPINVVIFRVRVVFNLWRPQTSQKSVVCPVHPFLGGLSHSRFIPVYSLSVSASSAAVRCIDISRTQSSIQVSGAGLFRYFLLTRLLKSGVFVVRCRVPLISLQSRSKMILWWQNELLLLHRQRLDEVLLCIHLWANTASYKSFECRLIEGVFKF